jgi:NTP pyrophosphatase (non-canonical NTP hydrolase)
MMIDLDQIQKEIYQNKVNRGFNVTDVGKEIVLMVEELGELARAYKNSDKRPAREIDRRDEMADAVGDLMIYCLGMCEMLGVSGENILRQIVENNKTRSHTGWM